MPIPLIVGAGLAATGIATQVIAGNQAADAQENIANAQRNSANQTRDIALRAAQPTTAELQVQLEQYQQSQKVLARQEQLLNAVDPALMEAGKQALALLRGQDASVLNPLNKQRAEQRSQLVERLRSQMGEGAESSTAGIAALNKFDLDTASQTSQAQYQAIGQLLNTSLQARPNPYQSINESQNTLNYLQNERRLQIGAVTSTDTTKYAGAPYAGDAARAQVLNGVGQTISSLGGQLIGAGATAASAGSSSALTPSETSSLQTNLGSLNKSSSIGQNNYYNVNDETQ